MKRSRQCCADHYADIAGFDRRPDGRTMFAPTVICADITSMNRQKWAVEDASPYIMLLYLSACVSCHMTAYVY